MDRKLENFVGQLRQAVDEAPRLRPRDLTDAELLDALPRVHWVLERLNALQTQMRSRLQALREAGESPFGPGLGRESSTPIET